MKDYKLLGRMNLPGELKHLDDKQLNLLCSEIRAELLDTVSNNGGHLSSNLGAVEFTVALHRVFESPQDQLIWDVGHQAYTHKLLTGRYDNFSTLRTEGGMTGFTNPQESEHDVFYSGHSSTSISAACGLAKAKQLRGEKGTVVAVIGDGALTGGMAYEGLNNAAKDAENLIILVNDNQMSISKNVGAVARYFAVIRTSMQYYRFKKRLERFLLKIPVIGKPIARLIFRSKYALKGILYNSTFFEDMGFRYLGPIDGHNLKRLEDALQTAKEMKKAVVVHVETVKGKGYDHAQADPELFHGISKFDLDSGEPIITGKSFSSEFGINMLDFASKDKRICGITAAMVMGTGLEPFMEKYPQRFFDVGIAEQHAVTFASGLAKNGMLPVFAVYSTFLQRAYDQLLHDVSLQKQKVVFAIDRAGFVGEDGETHQGIFDVAMLNTIPDMHIYAPVSYEELRHHLFEAFYKNETASAIRYPRGQEPKLPEDYQMQSEPYTCYHMEDAAVLIVTYGRLFGEACKAEAELRKQGIQAGILKLGRIKPIAAEIIPIAKKFERIYFYEEGIRNGGIGEQLLQMLEDAGYNGKFYLKAIETTFVKPASVARQLELFGLDAAHMLEDIGG